MKRLVVLLWWVLSRHPRARGHEPGDWCPIGWQLRLGRQADGWVHDGLVLLGRQSSQTVLSTTAVILALDSGGGNTRLCGNVGEAEFIDVVCGEVPLHEVLVHGRTGMLPVLAPLLPGGGEPLVVPADPPRGPPTHHLAGVGGCKGRHPVAVGVVVVMRVEQGAGPVGLDQVRLRDLLFPPAVVGLVGELQGPQGHRDRDPVGELTRERVVPFPGRLARDR